MACTSTKITSAQADCAKQLVAQAGPKSVSRDGVTTVFRSADDLIKLDEYCRRKAAFAKSPCIIDECVMDFGGC